MTEKLTGGRHRLEHLSGTWSVDEAVHILNASGHHVTVRGIFKLVRDKGWITGYASSRSIKPKAWQWLDEVGETLLVTGPGIAELNRILGGRDAIDVKEVGVLR